MLHKMKKRNSQAKMKRLSGEEVLLGLDLLFPHAQERLQASCPLGTLFHAMVNYPGKIRLGHFQHVCTHP